MKLMTLNTHSLAGADYPAKLRRFAEGIAAERPDLIALQEVNQTIAAPEADGALLTGYVPAQGAVPLRADNHAAHAARLLRESGLRCSWTYLPVKVGYGRYDEGLAFISLTGSIACTETVCISRSDDYADWKTRKALGIRLEGCPDWFCTVHMGWWDDVQEPFLPQWKALQDFASAGRGGMRTWLMGDFNAPAEVRGESYDRIAASGWHDTWLLAARRRGSETVPGEIDGWRNGQAEHSGRGMRIDHIWCSAPVRVTSASVVFNGENHPVVSDHFGVMIETGADETEQ